VFDYENDDEPVANPKNHFRIEYFKVMANQIKSNLHTLLDFCRIC
jgi:hypothetical protein